MWNERKNAGLFIFLHPVRFVGFVREMGEEWGFRVVDRGFSCGGIVLVLKID